MNPGPEADRVLLAHMRQLFGHTAVEPRDRALIERRMLSERVID